MEENASVLEGSQPARAVWAPVQERYARLHVEVLRRGRLVETLASKINQNTMKLLTTSNNLQKSAANREFSIFDKIPLKDITVMFPSQKIRKNSHQKSESLEN